VRGTGERIGCRVGGFVGGTVGNFGCSVGLFVGVIGGRFLCMIGVLILVLGKVCISRTSPFNCVYPLLSLRFSSSSLGSFLFFLSRLFFL